MHPKLRPVETHPVMHHGRPAIMLRDPLGLSDRIVILPQALAPLLVLCDGTRDAAGLRAGLAIRTGLLLSQEDIDHLLRQLDEALMLDNGRLAEAKATALEVYRSAPYRRPALAGASYPADPGELRAMLQRYIHAVPADTSPVAAGRGLISPHIDYRRGGSVYAQVWTRATNVVRDADLAIIFGTDHNGSPGQITLTRQHYATPFGVLATATDIIDQVAEAIGPDEAFAEELHHCQEHSVELAAVWLHHMRNGRPIETVPILCGSFHHFVMGVAEPREDPRLAKAISILRTATANRSTVVIAAADLAHVGPAFGDPHPIDWVRRARLTAADETLIQAICRGDAAGFFDLIREEGDRRRICGLPPIYLTLRLLGGARGELAGYDRCPADARNTSFVSVCGVVLT